MPYLLSNLTPSFLKQKKSSGSSPSPTSPILIDDDDDPLPTMENPSSHNSILLLELKKFTASLPTLIPEGVVGEPLARYSGNPCFELEDGDEPWEFVDNALNQTIGFGTTPEDIAKFVRRGPLGMDGLCHWLQACIVDLKIDEVLLEGKIDRVIEATKIWYV